MTSIYGILYQFQSYHFTYQKLIFPFLPPDVPDPCRGVSCGPGALCRPTPDGRAYNCECPTSCPSYGDHEGSRPLCASDARDYPGECEMRRAACDTNTNITFKYYGKCGECSLECRIVDSRSHKYSRWPRFRPLCVSDAWDYPGECEMRRAACDTNTNITLKYYGKCGKYCLGRYVC